jgi:hypothetical protein
LLALLREAEAAAIPPDPRLDALLAAARLVEPYLSDLASQPRQALRDALAAFEDATDAD